MKRSTGASILGLILCLIISLYALAQASNKDHDQKKQLPGKVQEGPSPLKNDWKTLKLGGSEISVLRLFTKGTCPPKVKDRKREIAILDLSDAQYKDFVKAPEDFVNNFEVFSCRVTRKLDHCKRSQKTVEKASVGDPLVMVAHDPDCGGNWN